MLVDIQGFTNFTAVQFSVTWHAVNSS